MNKVIIKNGAFQKLPSLLRSKAEQFVIIADGNLRSLGEELLGNMRRSGFACNLILAPSGEHAKSLSYVEKISNNLVKLGLKRDGCLIALGGGVIGDLTGFIASIYMRGIPFVSVPTTLLSMGDSSIGGKTGVDLPAGKNLLGTFYPSVLAIMDPLLLKTLPDREFKSGMAEIIKHGIIADRAFFTFMEKNASKITGRQPAALHKLISGSVRIKTGIVKKDERESIKRTGSRSRMLLNYGHTVGHALEKLSGDEMPHGEAVAVGMVAENRVAVGKGLLKRRDQEKILAVLKLYKLPTKIPAQYSSAAIKRAIFADKKNIGGKLHFALPVRIGKARIVAL